MVSVLLLGVLLAVIFFGLHIMLCRRGDDRFYRRVTMIGAMIGIAIAFGLFAAIQLGFIPDHAP